MDHSLNTASRRASIPYTLVVPRSEIPGPVPPSLPVTTAALSRTSSGSDLQIRLALLEAVAVRK